METRASLRVLDLKSAFLLPLRPYEEARQEERIKDARRVTDSERMSAMKTNKRCGNSRYLETIQKKNSGPFRGRIFRRLTCKKCGEHLLEHGNTERLDKAIEESISKITQTLITEIICREECTQEELAIRIGITPPHLSILKIGAKTLGFQTFNIDQKDMTKSQRQCRGWNTMALQKERDRHGKVEAGSDVGGSHRGLQGLS